MIYFTAANTRFIMPELKGEKVLNPYTRLKTAAKRFADKVTDRRAISGFYWNRGETISSSDLIQAVTTAKQLGYVIEAYTTGIKNDKIYFRYVEKLPSVPYELF